MCDDHAKDDEEDENDEKITVIMKKMRNYLQAQCLMKEFKHD